LIEIFDREIFAEIFFAEILGTARVIGDCDENS
jgi:hypothetical protein